MYVLSRTLNLVHCKGEWYVSNPRTNTAGELETSLSEFIDFCVAFFPGTGPKEGIKERFGENLSVLREEGYVVDDDALPDVESLLEDPKLQDLYDVLRFHAMRDTFCFFDYAVPETKENDEQTMRELAAVESPPLPTKVYDRCPQLSLPHPLLTSDVSIVGRVGSMLFFSFGCLRDAHFYDHNIVMKTVPSNGARHPFEAYLSVKDSEHLQAGLYHYDCRSHRLSYIASEPLSHASEMMLLVTCIFERVQWRYRHSWSYRDVFHDLGHVVFNLRATAAALQVGYKEPAAHAICMHPSLLNSPLTEEIVFGMELSN